MAVHSSEGVDPLFESTLYNHTPCLQLIGEPVSVTSCGDNVNVVLLLSWYCKGPSLYHSLLLFDYDVLYCIPLG